VPAARKIVDQGAASPGQRPGRAGRPAARAKQGSFDCATYRSVRKVVCVAPRPLGGRGRGPRSGRVRVGAPAGVAGRCIRRAHPHPARFACHPLPPSGRGFLVPVSRFVSRSTNRCLVIVEGHVLRPLARIRPSRGAPVRPGQPAFRHRIAPMQQAQPGEIGVIGRQALARGETDPVARRRRL
jgi:hypothetical protein